jgi:8-oxo-dGTP diphosphatase
MQDGTLLFLVRGEPPTELLLGWKKVGFGAGKYDGFGGKIEPGETVMEAALRELAEECGVRAREASVRPVAYLDFRFPHRPEWDQVVYAYLATAWDGEPVETDEMIPQWYALADIPYAQMWQDGRLWLPQVLAGECLRGRFVFSADNETLEQADLHDWDGKEPRAAVNGIVIAE